MKKWLYPFLFLSGLSVLRGLFGIPPIHPLFGLMVLLHLASKNTLLRKRFLGIALLVGGVYEFIDPISPHFAQMVASMGAYLAVREAAFKFSPPQKLILPLFTILYSMVFELTIFIICIHYTPTPVIVFKRLLLLPLLDGIFSFLWFLLPKYVISFLHRKEKTTSIDA